MRRSALIAAAVGGLLSSSAFAAFTFTATLEPLAGPNDAVVVRAINDGTGGTGTRLAAFTLNYQLTPGALARFLVNDTDNPDTGEPANGTPDTVDFANGANAAGFGYVRLGGASTTFVASATPTNGFVEPNPYLNGVNSFGLAATTTAAVKPLATGAGTIISRLIFNDGAGFVLTGSIAGETGPTQQISPFTYSPVVTPPGNPVVTPAAAIVQFGSIVSNGQTFSVNVNVADPDGGLLTLAAGAASGGSVSNVTISPAGGANSPAVFTVSGTVAYAPNGTIVTIPVTATDAQGNTGASTITLTLVPEPTTLAALAGAAGLGLIRRRK